MLAAPAVTDLRAATTRSGAAAAAAAPGAPPADPSHVWYVSYGSNLLRERFEVYLLGGTVAGLDRTYPGGPGTAPASAERPVVLPGRLRFGHDAPQWGGGGVAFWDPDGHGPGVLARAWRVTLRQYLEVVHLENGGTARLAAPWPDRVLADGGAVLDEGWYGRLVVVGALDGEPALTFTAPAPAAVPPGPPSSRYAGVVARGLVETFGAPARGGLDDGGARRYLRAAYSEG
ncbi:histone deacetylase [Aquipuribacter hungaricus]|uniref:Histone deacetylase n=1 Tax=Aquipuribacter hungaricus TaxID=545624 RepID=A0ABV7WL33_9MICO